MNQIEVSITIKSMKIMKYTKLDLGNDVICSPVKGL